MNIKGVTQKSKTDLRVTFLFYNARKVPASPG